MATAQTDNLDSVVLLLNNLISDTGYSVTNDIEYQLKYMNSETFNDDFDVIYNRLNRLYEKTRYLFELSNAIDYTLKDYISSVTEEIDLILSSIETQRDTLKRNTDIIFPVSFKNKYNTDSLDRDGSVITDKAFLTNGVLTLPFSSVLDIDNVTKLMQVNDYNSFKSYNYSKYNKLAEGGAYRTLYCSSSPLTVKEKVSIVFDTPIKMNALDLKLSNCNFENLVYIFDNDSKVSIDNITSISTTRLITGIEFDIVCSSGTTNTYTVEETTDTESYLNLKKSELYGDWANKLSTSLPEIKEYIKAIDTFDNVRKKYGVPAFFCDDQSLENQATKDGGMFSAVDANTYGNPYPQIETGFAYGTKEAH